MAFQINAYGRSVPTNFNDGINRQITQSPTRILLAEFGITTTAVTDVILNATVGWESLLGLPQVQFTVIRDTGVLGTARSTTFAVSEEVVTSFQLVDRSLPAGFHVYQLFAEVTNGLLNNAAAVGPVSFTGIALQNI